MKKCLAWLLLACGLQNACPGEMPDRALEEWIASAAPVREHARLQRLEGTWKVHQRDWLDGGTPWNEADGVAVYRMLLDGRFVLQELSTTLKGRPYHGTGILGFHRESAKYVGIWMDDFGTSLLRLEGDYDEPARTLSLRGYLGAAGDPNALWEMKDAWQDDDHHTVQWWGPGPAGTRVKTVEITYTRASKRPA